MILDTSQIEPIDMSAVIGKRYLFGRLIHLPRGFHVEVIGKMMLNEGGSLAGYRNSAEAEWKPYDHGFAFANDAGRWWFPTSLWSHSYQGMLLGYYNHTGACPHNLCLVPDVPMPRQGSFIYVIASCLHYFRTTIPKLLFQLKAEGIATDCIKVVVNGAPENHMRTEHGVDYCFTTHQAWEFSAFYEASRWDFDYATILQDTSEIMPGFREKCETMNGHFSWDVMPACVRMRCTLGIFRRSFLVDWKAHFASLDGMSKHEAAIREVAAEMVAKASRVISTGYSVWSKGDVSQKFGGAHRFKVEFPTMGVRKYIHNHCGYGPQSSSL